MCKYSALFFALLITSGSSYAQTRSIATVSNVEFQSVESTGFVLNNSQKVTVEATLLESSENFPSPSLAWIIDGSSRKTVWVSDIDSGRELSGPLVEVKESVSLPAGPYEVYYAGYVDWSRSMKWNNGRGIAQVVSTVLDEVFGRGKSGDWGDFEEDFEDNADELGVVVYGSSGRMESNTDALSESFLENAFLTITSVGDEAYVAEGFELTESTDIEVYALGEIEDEDRYDYGWLIDTESRETVWSMNMDNSEPAGGAWKNRLVRTKLTLPPGSYSAFYVSDDSHSAEEWNSPPPYDPDFWGLTLKVLDAGKLSSIKRFDYQNVNLDNALVALRQVGDDAHRSAGFSVNSNARVRIYSIGEGDSDEMYDYAWIVNAADRQRVWTMEYRQTEPAGGSKKNRVFDGTIMLPKGDYIVHYVTDGSHSYGDWNSDRPYDTEGWGVTVLPASKDVKTSFSTYDELSDSKVIARIAAVRDDAYKRYNFNLKDDTTVRIYALGEGQGGEMHDYGWIENSSTGRVVWEMTYRMSEHAGGSKKNRMVNNTIGLPAGSYTVFFQTDGSHAFGDWNSSAPSDPENWGITILRVK